MRTRIVTFSLLLAFATACATPPPAGRYPAIDLKVGGEDPDPALAEQLLAELTDLKPVEFRSPDGVLTGTVLAQGPVEAGKAARGYMVSVALGTAQPLKCTIQDGVLGMSAFARTLAEAFLASHDAYAYKYAFAGTSGPLLYLVLHGQYADKRTDARARRTGFLKMVVAGRGELTVACFHDQFGYRETIERVALSLIDTLELDRMKRLRPLVRRSVFSLRKAEQPVGVREIVIRADDEGFRRSWTRTAFLSVQGPQRLHALDLVETYDSDPDGRVFAQTYQVREDGKVRVEVSLEEKPMTDYEVSGQFDDTPMKNRFSLPEGVPDLLLRAAYRLERESYDAYLPTVDASRPSVVVVEQRTPKVTIKAGDQVMTGELDEAGHWVRGTRSDGYSFERTTVEP